MESKWQTLILKFERTKVQHISKPRKNRLRPPFTKPKETGNFCLLLCHASTVMLRNVGRRYPHRSVFVLRAQASIRSTAKKCVAYLLQFQKLHDRLLNSPHRFSQATRRFRYKAYGKNDNPEFTNHRQNSYHFVSKFYHNKTLK